MPRSDDFQETLIVKIIVSQPCLSSINNLSTLPDNSSKSVSSVCFALYGMLQVRLAYNARTPQSLGIEESAVQHLMSTNPEIQYGHSLSSIFRLREPDLLQALSYLLL